MKRKKHILKLVCFLLITINFLSLTGCYRIREKKYYSDESNFITSSAKVENIYYKKESKKIFILLDPDGLKEEYSDNIFVIEGKNVDILFGEKVLEVIKIGDEIIFTAAPRYFGDGYDVPIVALSIDGEDLLSFEEGYKNLMDSYRYVFEEEDAR